MASGLLIFDPQSSAVQTWDLWMEHALKDGVNPAEGEVETVEGV